MSNELFVSRLGAQTWAALREEGRVAEFYVETEHDRPQLGRIIKARVSRIMQGIQSAFLDIGSERGGFLHAADLLLPGEDASADEVSTGQGRRRRSFATNGPPIEDRLKVGVELLVQVSREPVSSKGARVTSYITLPGRLVVLSPHIQYRGVSRRIVDKEERQRLEQILLRLPGSEIGFVARTAACDASEEDMREDAEKLLIQWEEILARAELARPPSIVSRESGLLSRLLRDLRLEDLDRIVVDDTAQRNRTVEFIRDSGTSDAPVIELHDAPDSLVDTYGLRRELGRLLRPRCWLRSGGHVMIEETEALVSVDVNTGKFQGARRLEETALKTNLEAAVEIARQLRLRDLGGIIVIDFIDMESEESRTQVIDMLEQNLRRDRARTRVIGISELGLVQLTRKRTRQGTAASLTERCRDCAGTGNVRNQDLAAAEVLLELRRQSQSAPGTALVVRSHPELARRIELDLEIWRQEGPAPRVQIRLEPNEAYRPARFEVVRDEQGP